MTLQELGNKAAKELPEGYLIEFNVEKDAGWVNLYYDGEEVGFATNYESIIESFLDALEHAKENPNGPDYEA